MMKALVIGLAPNKNVEDVIQVAKAEAFKIGFGDKEVLEVPEIIYSSRLNMWIVVVQNSGSKRRKE